MSTEKESRHQDAPAGEKPRTYAAIDLKSFYASVECRERGLDPLTTNLVVADNSRTQKTICLAVSPSLKAVGLPGRARLFEVVQKVEQVNATRQLRYKRPLTGSSVDAVELSQHPEMKLDYVTAVPQMQKYMDCSAKIYSIYLKYIAPEDIHVYSVDEVFLDYTNYLNTYKMSAHELTRKIISEILSETGITATAGIAPNMFLCKVAMDIVAKHIPADEDGVRIAEIDIPTYRRTLWNHRPITDFWRVGPGVAKKLADHGIYTMGDIAYMALKNEDYLFKLFGVNAEYLIDHAFGYEPTTIAEIKAYKPKSSSVGEGQILCCDEPKERARIIVKEMAENLSLQLLDAGLETDQIVLDIAFEALKGKTGLSAYDGEIKQDHYGRFAPKPGHGSENLPHYTNSTALIVDAANAIFDRICPSGLKVRRIGIAGVHTRKEGGDFTQMSLFDFMGDGAATGVPAQPDAPTIRGQMPAADLERERRAQLAVLELKKKFGKNAVVKARDLQEGATAIQRNKQIGGHKA